MVHIKNIFKIYKSSKIYKTSLKYTHKYNVTFLQLYCFDGK